MEELKEELDIIKGLYKLSLDSRSRLIEGLKDYRERYVVRGREINALRTEVAELQERIAELEEALYAVSKFAPTAMITAIANNALYTPPPPES